MTCIVGLNNLSLSGLAESSSQPPTTEFPGMSAAKPTTIILGYLASISLLRVERNRDAEVICYLYHGSHL